MDRANNVIYAVSTLQDGNMSFLHGEKDEVIENRKRFLAKNNIPLENCVVMNVAHGDTVILVTEADRGRGVMTIEDAVSGVDALITNKKDVALFLLIADCLPVIYFDPKKEVVALAHLGWESIDKKLPQKVVGRMQEQFGSNPEDIRVTIGPGIKKSSYKVKNPKQKDDPAWRSFLGPAENEEFYIDLEGYVCSQLQTAGILEKNIKRNNIDTFQDKNFYSHYRAERTGEKEGRFAVVVSLQ